MPVYFGGYSGMILAFSSDKPPSGWLNCDGALLDGNNPLYVDLWNAIGTTYGGTGQSSFQLPNLVGSAISGASNSSPAGSVDGAASHTHSTSTSVTTNAFNDGAHSHGLGELALYYTSYAYLYYNTFNGFDNTNHHNVGAAAWGASTSNTNTAVSTGGTYATAKSNHFHNVAGQYTSGYEGGNLNRWPHAHYHSLTASYPVDSSGSHNHSTSITNSAVFATQTNLNAYHNVCYMIKL